MIPTLSNHSTDVMINVPQRQETRICRSAYQTRSAMR
jgi:hypothetical protein